MEAERRAGFEVVLILEMGGGGCGDLDAARCALGLDVSGDRDGIAPEVIDKVLGSGAADDDGTGVDTDADLELLGTA